MQAALTALFALTAPADPAAHAHAVPSHQERAERFAPESVAPSLVDVQWQVAQPEAGVVERAASSEGLGARQRPRGEGYPAWYGFPVLVLSLPVGDNVEAVAFGELAQRANEDRGLVVVTISAANAPPADADEAPEFVAPSSALLAGVAPETSAWCPDAAPRAIVLGPTGEVVGGARPLTERAELLEALESALGRYPAVPIQADLGDAVREAQALYFAGEWDAARKSAEKLAKKLERGDPSAAAAATSLVVKVQEQERALRAALIEANRGMNSAHRLATIVAATRRGFPRGAARDEAETAADLQRKDMGRDVAYRVAEAWVEALPERPALFPEVPDARGKRYAKRLDALTKRATFDGDLTRLAKSLLLRYELAAQR